MNVTAPDQVALALLQAQVRGAPVVVTPPGAAPIGLTPAIPLPTLVVTADPLAALLQSGAADVSDTSLPIADLARRYAENGTVTQHAADDVVSTKPDLQINLGATEEKLLSNLTQAYRQTASATPLPQPANVQREIANAQIPNAPGTAGNAPAVIVIDGKSLPLNAAQTTLVRAALASGGAPDAKLITGLFQPVASQDPDGVPLPQPASAIPELASAAIAQPETIERGQVNLQPRQQAVAPSLLRTATAVGDASASLLAETSSIEPNQAALQSSAPRQQSITVPLPPPARDAAVVQLRAAAPEIQVVELANAAAAGETASTATAAAELPAAAAAAIIVDGRIIALSPAQIAIVRANLEASFRKAGPGIGASDSEDPTVQTAHASDNDAIAKAAKVQTVEASVRSEIETPDRQARPAPNDMSGMQGALGNDEKVEAVRAISHEHPTAYEPQLILPRPQDQIVIAPGPDRILLAGQQPSDTAAQPAITGIALSLAPGITRDDVTAELHQDGYRLTFAGSDDSLVLHARAGLSAQLVFADGTSMRLQLSHD